MDRPSSWRPRPVWTWSGKSGVPPDPCQSPNLAQGGQQLCLPRVTLPSLPVCWNPTVSHGVSVFSEYK